MAENITPAQVPEVEEVTQILGFNAVNKWAKMPGAKISQAVTMANDAKTAANEAKTMANDAKTAADEAKTMANEAKTAANEAKTAVNEAKTVATTAKTMADNAMPKSGGVFTGPVHLQGNSSTDSGTMAATCQFVIDYLNSEKNPVNSSVVNNPTFSWFANHQVFIDRSGDTSIGTLQMKSPLALTGTGQGASCRMLFIASGKDYTVRIDASNSNLSQSSAIDMVLADLDEGETYAVDINVCRITLSDTDPEYSYDVLLVSTTCNHASIFHTNMISFGNENNAED